MESARDGVLLRGLIDWFGLERVHWYVANENPRLALSLIQTKTLALVEELAEEGLVELGELSSATHRFVRWDVPLPVAMTRIREPYLTQFDDYEAWWFVCWINLTSAGDRLAENIEANRSNG